MASSSDENAKNRYHTFQSYKAKVRDSSIQPGVSQEYVHDLLVRLDSLTQTLNKTVNLPTVNPVLKEYNKDGVLTLQSLASQIDAQLQEPNITHGL